MNGTNGLYFQSSPCAGFADEPRKAVPMSDNSPPANPRQSFLSDAERVQLLEANVTDYAIFMADTEERVASWNAGATRILGYTEPEILGQPVAIIFTQEDQQNGDEQKEFKTARDTGRSDDERWHVRKDGSRFWALGILTALYDEQGRLRGYAKILRDFTARKRYEDRIEALNARLQWAMTETHHRVKNNLQLISAIIDMQSHEYGDTVPIAEYKHLGTQVRALAALHDILAADTKAGSDATMISLPALLEELLSLLQSIASKSRIQFKLADVQVSANKGSSIALIVNELVTNAIKHGSDNVLVTLSDLEGNITLSVRDDGLGFAEGFEAKSFSSAGLELVENLVRLDLRGKVSYTNLPEGGGCVTVLCRINQ